MLKLKMGPSGDSLHVLCLGAHSDDIEIGCSGTLLRWLSEYSCVKVTWCVLSAAGERAEEARRSAQTLLRGASTLDLVLGSFKDAHFPAQFSGIKAFLRKVHRTVQPDIVLTHHVGDAHQDHRMLAEQTWQTWRDQLIMEYEVPKFEGDLGQPNLFVQLPDVIARAKVKHLMEHFGSQHSKHWYTESSFLSLMQLRALECRAPQGFAEAFHVKKAVL